MGRGDTEESTHSTIKCVVWDLDGTLWDGTLAEGDDVSVRSEAVEAVIGLDRRGILQSIASKNDPLTTVARLEEVGLLEYFLYPQIGWSPKSRSVAKIAGLLDVSLDAVAFIDDQIVEREEVRFAHPEVMLIDASRVVELLSMSRMRPRFVTEESRMRRTMYRTRIDRLEAEERFEGPQVEFLKTLGLELEIAEAGADDLLRAEELTVRTHQMNSTGVVYGLAELSGLIGGDSHRVLVARMRDRYGSYGTIGLAVLRCPGAIWTIDLLLVSCRVIFAGVGNIMLGHLRRLAFRERAQLFATMRPTNRNRMMYATFKFAGFREVSRTRDSVLLEARVDEVPPIPEYVKILVAQPPAP